VALAAGSRAVLPWIRLEEADLAERAIDAQGIHRAFGLGTTRIVVLRGCDLHVETGELVAIAGSSGSGKSTLLHILGGLLHPDEGRALVAGHDLYALSERRRARVCNREIGFVFQMHHLLPEFTALENILMPAWIAGTEEAAARTRALDLLDRLGLAERAMHRPGELSGGEQQRVAVARALINNPRVVLADEPSGNLDPESSDALHGELEALARDSDQAFLVATHSQELAARAHRVLLLDHGSLHPTEAVKSVP
jgi:lipoprotein-releasing system ATP-binding protein